MKAWHDSHFDKERFQKLVKNRSKDEFDALIKSLPETRIANPK